MSWNSILQAHAHWRRSKAAFDTESDLDQTECFILSETPANAAEAACILEVICANGGDVRCDGLDLAALGRVHNFLSAAR